MLPPLELKKHLPIEIANGEMSTRTDVWNILVASKEGRIDSVKDLVAQNNTCYMLHTIMLHLFSNETHAGTRLHVEFMLLMRSCYIKTAWFFVQLLICIDQNKEF